MYMHAYATNSDERKMVRLYLATLSILGAWVLHLGLQSISFVPPWWLELPSFLGLYGLLHTIFDRWLWCFPAVRKIGLSKIPDLTGTWVGHVASSFDDHKTLYEGTAKIRQSWTQISITWQTEKSESHSQTASIITELPHKIYISYEYLNEPRADAQNTMHLHRGMARLFLRTTDECEVLDGEYFTGRGRGTFGRVYLERNKPSRS